MLLRLASFTFAAAFAAIAIYISVVEQPSRLLLDEQALLAQWSASYPAAMKIQGALAILAGLSGMLIWFRSNSLIWLIGAILILLNWPYTLVALNPINQALLSMAAAQTADASRALVEQWGWLHAVRSALGLTATVLFALGLLRDTASPPKRLVNDGSMHLDIAT